MDALLTKINDLCAEVELNTTNLNRGGCCVFAAAMGKKLQPFGSVRIRVLNGYYTKKNINELKNNIHDENSLEEWNNNGVIFYHVIVEFRYKRRIYHIDLTGVHRSIKNTSAITEDGLHDGWFTVEQAENFAKSTNWNWMFNRGQIPKIHKMIDRFSLN